MHARRLQILLDEGRYERVADEARRRGVSVAAHIREAIDRGLPASATRRRAAADRILSAPDMPVPGDVSELRAEPDPLRLRRQ
jgi:hypothetical protein